MRAELGTWRAFVLDTTTVNQFTIGQQSNDPTNPPSGNPHRALNRIHWKNLTGNHAIANNTFNCIGNDIFAIDCHGDITNTSNGGPDGNVGIDDLLAVISGWGSCSGPPALPTVLGDPCPSNLSPCKADVAPLVVTGPDPVYGNNVVDIDDLLAVISAWGPCDSTSNDQPPESVNDCWVKCSEQYTEGSPLWHDCYSKCIESLCLRNLINCD
jgi:hypothetical protein